jgi:hypothetical protein
VYQSIMHLKTVLDLGSGAETCVHDNCRGPRSWSKFPSMTGRTVPIAIHRLRTQGPFSENLNQITGNVESLRLARGGVLSLLGGNGGNTKWIAPASCTSSGSSTCTSRGMARIGEKKKRRGRGGFADNMTLLSIMGFQIWEPVLLEGPDTTCFIHIQIPTHATLHSMVNWLRWP